MNYSTAIQEISAGRAKAHQLWLILSCESDRDGFALRPFQWEGQGEYQHVTHEGRDGLVRIPVGRHLPTQNGRS